MEKTEFSSCYGWAPWPSLAIASLDGHRTKVYDQRCLCNNVAEAAWWACVNFDGFSDRDRIMGRGDKYISETMQNQVSWSERETVNLEVIGSIPAKHQNTWNSNLNWFDVRRTLSKGTKLLFQVIKANINQKIEWTEVQGLCSQLEFSTSILCVGRLIQLKPTEYVLFVVDQNENSRFSKTDSQMFSFWRICCTVTQARLRRCTFTFCGEPRSGVH